MFMPVGTQASIKGLTPEMVRGIGAQMILANTYHLALRPGDELIRELGGLHRFMHWEGPILTDSGGFQVFSLASQVRISDRGALFRSHIDGQLLELTPERAVRIQENLGSDIAMVLDECPPAQASAAQQYEAVRRTILWAQRCRESHSRHDQALFAIVQGGLDESLRRQCAHELVQLDFAGYALGGFSVGEPPEQMHALLPICAALLPADRPRYLMGVGRPTDILAAIAAGIDLFDCVMPTRNGRNAQAFTSQGVLRLRNACHRRDPRPLDPQCDCYCCQHYCRAYLHHLFAADEMLGPILVSLHNLAYYVRLVRLARQAILEGRWVQYYNGCLQQWQRAADEPS
jgi:queuine tRNA-ribosyltransferase